MNEIFVLIILSIDLEIGGTENVSVPAVASVYGGGNDNVEAVGLKSAPVALVGDLAGDKGEGFSPKPVNADNLQ
ncbi:hypothetical protein DERP_001461 [Dermatophagoides pteronyssinus]|uniref:Uncharacterized protein n=1 Tax=Dermatophagoides pteronyssinus TaxID=6956 RepID=A0ABQ8JF18_DERPT|nr:hypothetical protein DERP_001461 [Dermatophagoides pteronyssinus]